MPRGNWEEYLYPFFNLGTRGGRWSILRSGRLNPGKETRYPFLKKAGWTRDRSGRVRNIRPPPPGLDLRTFQPVEIRYTDCTIPVGSEIFHTPPDLPWGPPSLLYNGQQAPFPGVKRSGSGDNHLPRLAPRLKKKLSYTSNPNLDFIASSKVNSTLTFNFTCTLSFYQVHTQQCYRQNQSTLVDARVRNSFTLLFVVE